MAKWLCQTGERADFVQASIYLSVLNVVKITAVLLFMASITMAKSGVYLMHSVVFLCVSPSI